MGKIHFRSYENSRKRLANQKKSRVGIKIGLQLVIFRTKLGNIFGEKMRRGKKNTLNVTLSFNRRKGEFPSQGLDFLPAAD